MCILAILVQHGDSRNSIHCFCGVVLDFRASTQRHTDCNHSFAVLAIIKCTI